jgi:hypothetical protein
MQSSAAVGLAGCLFFLLVAGWSVQWVLYLIPLLLVASSGVW